MRVLVVEDEKKIAAFIKAGLSSRCCSVDLAPDGAIGSYLARTNDYDLVILDNVLPKKTGFEVCRDIRDRGKQIPILMLSVRADVRTKVELLNAGVDDYLAKPFSLEELIARMDALARRPQKLDTNVMKLDDLCLDSIRSTVTRGDARVYLTRKEFMLLAYLFRNRGHVVSRGMILEHVWDMKGDPFSNTIETHISSLRRKVDTAGHRKLIHTVPGRGYKLDLSRA